MRKEPGDSKPSDFSNYGINSLKIRLRIRFKLYLAFCAIGMISYVVTMAFELDRKYGLLIFVIGIYIVLPVALMIMMVRESLKKSAEDQKTQVPPYDNTR